MTKATPTAVDQIEAVCACLGRLDSTENPWGTLADATVLAQGALATARREAEVKAMLVEACEAALRCGLDEGEPVSHGYHSASAPTKQEKRAAEAESLIRNALKTAKAHTGGAE